MIPGLIVPWRRSLLTCGLAVGIVAALAGQPAEPPPQQPQLPGRPGRPQPSRDTSAGAPDGGPTPTGRISGHVATADTGRPVKRARILISAADLPGRRGTLTDDAGLFDFRE